MERDVLVPSVRLSKGTSIVLLESTLSVVVLIIRATVVFFISTLGFSVFNFQPLILGLSQNISLFSLGLWVGISFFYMVSEQRILIISQYAVLAIR